MTGVFEALADSTRRKILQMLKDGGMTAGEIAGRFNISQPSVSHHLSILKNAGLVTAEREGQYIRYYINLSVLEETLMEFYKLMRRDKDASK